MARNRRRAKKVVEDMKSLRELYRVGKGPSSSHTMGPESAARLFLAENPAADSFKVVLYGSLASTGEGHGTDRVLRETLALPTEIIFDTKTSNLPHPNTMDLYAYAAGEELATMRVLSVGGGAIEIVGREQASSAPVYSLHTFNSIAAYCKVNRMTLPEYVERSEGADIREYLSTVWQTMKNAIREGLSADGVLPGGLGVQRKAKYLFDQVVVDESADRAIDRLVCAYAYAVAEQNAAGGVISTAPTCGACGVLPAVLYDAEQRLGFSDDDIVRALETAGIVGNVIKHNASISGAECGCQAEIGSATSMAAAAIGELRGLSIDQIEYAAEIAMEHQLGLTCDPVGGLVQIPCIERNAVAATRALTAADLAQYLVFSHKVSFDTIVNTMYRTGRDMNSNYRETSRGGLAKTYVKRRRRKKRASKYTNKTV